MIQFSPRKAWRDLTQLVRLPEIFDFLSPLCIGLLKSESHDGIHGTNCRLTDLQYMKTNEKSSKCIGNYTIDGSYQNGNLLLKFVFFGCEKKSHDSHYTPNKTFVSCEVALGIKLFGQPIDNPWCLLPPKTKESR